MSAPASSSPASVPESVASSEVRERLTGAIAALTALLGPRASTTTAQREQHSHGESYHAPGFPDVVCFPRSTEEVSEILKISAQHQLPVVPFGAGTSLEGHVNAIHGGITIDLREMNQILRVNVEDMDATVQAGVTRTQLCKALNNTGLTFFIDPGADATLGGMTATRASGTTAVRYGTMRENVRGLTVVLADGRIIHTGGRARKSSAGYDLTHLFVGSEGTLGVITEITLRLHPLPESVAAAVCHFSSVEGAVLTAIETIQLGLNVARIEFLDDMQIAAINKFSKINLPESPTLFFEFHGMNDREVSDQSALLESLALEHGGQGFAWKKTLEDRDILWEARHNAYYATHALRPGAKIWSTDVCVPISRLAECIVETKREMAGLSFPATIVGHVGDGNFHVLCVLDPDSAAELDEASRFVSRMVGRALAMDGTSTGEHGVGIGKMKYLEQEHGEALDVMRTIKLALDPDNRMNPGKILPPVSS
jgi:D-lactate dehydrogenase (cytochrome)